MRLAEIKEDTEDQQLGLSERKKEELLEVMRTECTKIQRNALHMAL